jgi:hypothetical protein
LIRSPPSLAAYEVTSVPLLKSTVAGGAGVPDKAILGEAPDGAGLELPPLSPSPQAAPRIIRATAGKAAAHLSARATF